MKKFLIFSFGLVLSISLIGMLSGEEECPETGTSYDPLIKEAYDVHQKFVAADLSVDKGVNTFKEIFATTMGKSEEEKEELMAMADTAFVSMLSDEEVQAELKEKLTDEGKASLDTVKVQMDVALVDFRDANDAAGSLVKKIPGAIKELPSKFKGLNAMKIPKVKAALEKALGWANEVVDNVSPQITMVTSVVEIITGLVSGGE
jgi:hypothetical protein